MTAVPQPLTILGEIAALAHSSLATPCASLLCLLFVHVTLAVVARQLAITLLAPRAGGSGNAARLLLGTAIYFSAIVTVGLVLGVLRGLTVGWLIVGSLVAAAVLLVLERRGRQVYRDSGLARADSRATATTQLAASGQTKRPQSRCDPFSGGAGVVKGILWVVVAAVIWLALASPTYDYDVLTYHLTFPASWVQDAAISIVPTWFGDPAPAYAPCSTEVWYATLMLCTGDDRLARGAQVLFWLQLLLAAYVAGQALRLRPAIRLGLCLSLALIPALSAQAATAMVDVAFAAHLVSTAAFALRTGRGRGFGDAAGVALCVGLLLGTKFTAAAFLPALVPLLMWAMKRLFGRGCRRRGGLVVAAAILIAGWAGGFWYMRNWVVTGNPFYPLEVRIGSLRLLPGAFGREQMANSPFNARRGADEDAFGRTLWEALHSPQADEPPPRADGSVPEFARWYAGPVGLMVLAAAIAGALAAARRSPTEVPLVLLLICAGLAWFVFWYALPFQQSRFVWGPLVMTAIGGAALARLRPAVGVVLTLAVVAIWVRAFGFEWQAMGTGVLARLSVAAAPAGLLLLWQVTYRLPRRHGSSHLSFGPRSPPLLAAAVLTACAAVTFWIASETGDRPRRDETNRPRWRFHSDAWRWIDENVRHATIAYAGNNVPYFLLASGFENRVCYVPARHPLEGRYHDFAGLPETQILGPPHLAGAACDRFLMDPAVWMENLRTLGVRWVLVTSLFPSLLPTHRHDAEGFSIEREWLDALSEERQDGQSWAVCRLFGQGSARLYELDWSVPLPEHLPLRRVVQDETDALQRILTDGTPPGQPIRDYPHAAGFLQRHRLRPLQ